jgi:hypothetical protein
MNKLHPRHTFLRDFALLLAATALFAPSLFAQVPLEPAQMPANTSFYFIWRGQPSAELRKSNSIAALWDDPGFSPVRSSITQALLKNSQEKSTGPRLTREELEKYASLLENPFVLGYLTDPRDKGFQVSAKPPSEKPASWNGLFFIYNRSGKEALLSKAVLAMRASEKDKPEISPLTIAGVPALKIVRKESTTYWIEDGKYAVISSDEGVAKEILGRLKGGVAGARSLTESASYKEAQSLLGSGQVEFFLRVPDLKALASNANATAGPIQVRPILDAMKLDAIHSIAGRVLMEGAKTRIQGAAFGDTAPGTLFDIWGPGSSAPTSLNVIPADAVSYSDTQINLLGIYELLKRMATAIMPATGGNNVNMLEMMAQAKLGQSLGSAIALFTGEFTTLQTSPSLDNNKQIYLVGIHNKPDTVKLLHTVLGDKINSERNEGDVTFLKISTGGTQTAAGSAGWDFYHVAATSDYLIAAPRLETVREFIARRPQIATANLSAAPGYQTARAQFPEKINGFGYFDFRKVDWPALKARVTAEAAKNPPSKRVPGATKSTTPVTPSWMLDLNPEVFARHLHATASASWKDAQGLHFDEWIE